MADGRRLVAIVFTDIVGYTQLSQTDEPAALRLLQEHDRLLRPILDIHGGRRVKSMGDGMLIEFPNALAAVECGVDFQRHVHERNARAGSPPLRLRIGIHVGDVQRRGSDILGDAVNIASRIEPLADPGGICLTEQAVDLVRHRVAYPLEGLGAKNLKGVREAVGVYRLVLPWTNAEVAGSLAPAHRLAILPLSNISPDPKDEFIADGLTEELISTISRVPELSVISRTSVMQYKNQAKRMSEIGRELNVRTVLEGSVRKSGSRVRIAVQLIDAGDDKHLWAENYDRSLEDIFTIQSEIAQEIANALQIRLLEEDRARIGKVPTADTEAYLLYLKGRYQSELVTKEGSMTAIGYFEEAVQRDPKFALAFAAIAAAYHRLGFLEMLPSAEASAKADVAASRALALDPGLAEGHIALAWVLFHGLDFRGAMREVRRALELNPNLSGAHVAAGQTLQYAGRFEEAFAEMEKALELDPLSAPTLRRSRRATSTAVARSAPRSCSARRSRRSPRTRSRWDSSGSAMSDKGGTTRGSPRSARRSNCRAGPTLRSGWTSRMRSPGRVGSTTPGGSSPAWSRSTIATAPGPGRSRRRSRASATPSRRSSGSNGRTRRSRGTWAGSPSTLASRGSDPTRGSRTSSSGLATRPRLRSTDGVGAEDPEPIADAGARPAGRAWAGCTFGSAGPPAAARRRSPRSSTRR